MKTAQKMVLHWIKTTSSREEAFYVQQYFWKMVDLYKSGVATESIKMYRKNSSNCSIERKEYLQANYLDIAETLFKQYLVKMNLKQRRRTVFKIRRRKRYGS